MSEADEETRFCPVHGDYVPRAGSTVCPRCDEDPVSSAHSMRSVKVITSEMAAVTPPDGADVTSDDHLTTIDEVATCPSCGKLVPLDTFQTEAVGEEWEGDAALWAEDGVCRDCYRDVIPGMLRRWSVTEWLTHHFEGWKNEVRKVHEIEVLVDSDHDSWLPDEERHRILDVQATLSARREHLARAQMRLRDIRAEYSLATDPPEFVAELEDARKALDDEAIADLERRRASDLEREKERRVGSVTNLSPAQALVDSGLDPAAVLGELARHTGTHDAIDAADITSDGPGTSDNSRWPVVVIAVALIAFVVWWFGLR